MVISFWWVDTEIKNVIYASQLYKIVTQGNKKFWEIFDKVLKQQYSNKSSPKISDPSNATFNFENIKDEIPKGVKPKSASDLMRINQ